MKATIQNISVIGDGGWGTTLAVHLAKNGYPVTLWGAFPDYVRQMQKNRVNSKFLPGIRLPKTVRVSADLSEAVNNADLLVLATPSKYIGPALKNLKKFDYKDKIILSVIKGIDTAKLVRMSQLIHSSLGHNIHLAVLSGPTIAPEVARGIPSTAVIAARNLKIAKKIQHVFNSETFRIYTNTDLAGVELGGSLKNVIAIACGVCDGLGFGSNTKAAILSRGLAEMARLGQAMGAKAKTFFGLTGLGDLVTTCVSPKSRNRGVGEALGRGHKIRDILSKMSMVAEGVETVKAVYKLSKKYRVSMPISTEVYNIIYKNKKPRQAVQDLMTRSAKAE